jgi:hypothetical protein
MAKKTNQPILVDDTVINKIYLIRDKKVMLDRDLAEMYGVLTGNLNLAVRRNIERFPDDFMFQLSPKEFENLILQNATSSWGGTRKMPYAFTEQGVAMLSSVLKSKQAVAVNIQIIRVFSRMRELLITHKDILLKLEKLEKQVSNNNQDIQNIFEVLKELINEPNPPGKKMGYKHYDEEL